MADDKALQTALDLKKQDLDRNVTAEESANLKNSLLFQYNWPDLLQSAPTAINSMGACLIASSSPKAVVELDPPTNGFKHLGNTSLQANLTEMASLGRNAFNTAETGMGQISGASDIIYGKLRDILNSLGDPEAARATLKPQMLAVSRSSKTCADTAKEIETIFQDWLDYACEMHVACVQKQQTAADQALSNQVCIAAEQIKLASTQAGADTAKAAVDLLSKQVETTADAFKKASDSYPSGWDIVGQQIVGDLANCATTALKAAIPALVCWISPVAGTVSEGEGLAGEGEKIAGDFTNKGSANGVTNGATPNGTSAPPAIDNARVRPQSAADPASAEIVKDMTYIELLNAIVCGLDGGIDWEKARGGDDPKKSVAFVSSILEDAKKNFSSLKANTGPSNDVAKILDVATTVAAGILDVVNKNKSISADWPAKDDPQVKKWETDFHEQYLIAVKASAIASANNGGSTTTAIMSGADPATGDGMRSGDAQAKAILESAKSRLDTTQKAYLATQDNYLKASSMLVEQQNKIAEIQADLTKLTNQNITLTEIKAILIQAIKLIIQLKAQVNNLVQFFSAMTVIINTVVDLHITPFLATLKAITSGSDDPDAQWTIGNYTLTDYKRTNVYSSVLTLRTYFSVFGDIAKMWISLSIENIQPGINLCDELSVPSSDPNAISAKMNALAKWSQQACDHIKKITGDKQKEITDGMEARFQDVAASTKLLPASAPQQKAIEAAKVEQTAEVAQALDAKKKSSAFNRFAA